MIKYRGLDELVSNQKEKQHSFQEIPLLINGNILLDQGQGGLKVPTHMRHSEVNCVHEAKSKLNH